MNNDQLDIFDNDNKDNNSQRQVVQPGKETCQETGEQKFSCLITSSPVPEHVLERCRKLTELSKTLKHIKYDN